MIVIEKERQERVAKKIEDIYEAYKTRDMHIESNRRTYLESMTLMVLKTIKTEVNYQMQKIKHKK